MLIDASQILASVGSPMTTFKSLIVNNHGSNVIGSAQIDAAVPSFQGRGRSHTECHRQGSIRDELAPVTEEAVKDAT